MPLQRGIRCRMSLLTPEPRASESSRLTESVPACVRVHVCPEPGRCVSSAEKEPCCVSEQSPKFRSSVCGLSRGSRQLGFQNSQPVTRCFIRPRSGPQSHTQHGCCCCYLFIHAAGISQTLRQTSAWTRQTHCALVELVDGEGPANLHPVPLKVESDITANRAC